MASSLRGVLGLALVAALFVSVAEARQWTDRNGRTISANYVRVDGETVILQQGNKVLRVPIDSLSDGDQEFVKKQSGGKPPAGANNPPMPSPAIPPAANPANPGAAPNLTAERTWTDINGKTVQGRFDRMVGDSFRWRISARPIESFWLSKA